MSEVILAFLIRVVLPVAIIGLLALIFGRKRG